MENRQSVFKSTALLALWITILAAILIVGMLYMVATGTESSIASQCGVLDVYINGNYDQLVTVSGGIQERYAQLYRFMSVFLPLCLAIVVAIMILQVVWLRRSYQNLDALGRQLGNKDRTGLPGFLDRPFRGLVLLPFSKQALWTMLEEESLACQDEEPTHWRRLVWSGWCLALALLLVLGLCFYTVHLGHITDLLDVYQVVLGVVGIG